MKKVVYIIPGFKEFPERKIYKSIAELFEKKKIEPVLVKIDWNYKTINDWLDQFLADYYKEDNSKKYLFGFSYGALISFLVSSEKNIDSQILCSLSPYFKEDLPNIPKIWKRNIGKRRVEDFEKLEMTKLAPKIKTKTYLLYGTSEEISVKNRAEDTFKKLKSEKYLIPVNDAKHDITNENYLKEIEKVIKNLGL